MLRSSSSTQRLAGRLMVATAVAIALPLTASRAVDYVDVPAPAAQPAATVPVVAPAPVLAVPVQTAPALEAAAARPSNPPRPEPAAFAFDQHDDLTISGDLITIDGKTKHWEELTPAEKARVRTAVAKARASLAKTHIDEAKIMRDIASIPDRARMDELQRQLARNQAQISETVRRLNENAAQARASGKDPDQLEAAIRATLQSVQAIDMQNAAKALANVDRQKIAADVAGAQQSMEKAKAELARLQARIDADQH